MTAPTTWTRMAYPQDSASWPGWRGLRRGAALPLPWVLAAVLLAALAAGLLAWQWRAAQAQARMAAEGAARLAAHAAALTQLFERHQHLPRLLALEPRLLPLLQAPGADPGPGAAEAAGGAGAAQGVALVASEYLREAVEVSQIEAAYLMDRHGQVLATSNHRQPGSYLGHHYGFRPYFQQALAGGPGLLYAVGVTTRRPGLFLSWPVRAAPAAEVLGVVVVKVDLQAVERTWADGPGRGVALLDDQGVVILSSDPTWRYRSAQPLSRAQRQGLQASRRYGEQPVEPLAPALQLASDAAGDQTLRLDGPAQLPPGQPLPSLLQAGPAGPPGWRLLLLTELASARQAAALEATVAALAVALAGTALGLGRVQRRRRRERREADRALRAAHEQLEARIAERTQALTQANEALQARVQALHETERILHATRDQAVQAGKLAALGQMAAGISHELNQPLAALATCASNAAKQLERQHHEDLRESLDLMQGLTQRLGRIVAPLKGFARAGTPQRHPVPLAEALGMATLLLGPRLKDSGAQLQVLLDDDALQVLADRTRLEQVLVNLLRNALDALEALPPEAPRPLQVRAWRDDAWVRIAVADGGPGLPPQVLARLFEPFFTTRAGAGGLGLGLAVSRAIAQSLGGQLQAGSATPDQGGGACFTLSLEAVPAPDGLPTGVTSTTSTPST
ncbi:ATP-binding protein [Ideonella livida]|uniref:histidine kinase n=1 Tax=Ideonella livida TaxID=2707176 RepID=A0A7C9TI62_9BURK|nr:ATP-binding protein [Ideonella livida]NDY90184.1 sensor histidine kinase [Ideonella livida]